MTPQRRSVVLLLVIYLGFISLGLPDGTLGTAWPAIYPELNLPIGLAGTILTVGTALTALSGFASGRIVGRWGTGPVVLASGVLTASALLLLSRAQGAGWLYAAAVPLGLGAGAVDAGLNGYVAKHYSGRHMNWLHACWGIGATAGPFVLGWTLAHGHGWRGGYVAISSVQFSLAMLFLLTLGLWARVPERAAEHAKTAAKPPTLSARSFAGWLSPVILALYVAAEFTIGLWAGTVLVVRRGFTPETAALCTAGFYGAITVGRIAAGFVVEPWGNRRVISGGALLAAAGMVAFTLAATPMLAAASLVVTGMGMAPIYPGLMHEVPRRFAPDSVQTVIGWQSGGASIGAAVLPALAGWLAQQSLAGVPWLVIAVLLALIAAIRRLDRIT